MKLDLQPGHSYKDRNGDIWCCYRRPPAPRTIDAAAHCIRVLDGREEYFYSDGRYDEQGTRELCLVKECRADGKPVAPLGVTTAMTVAYLGHPLSAPTLEGMRANRMRASKWAAWLWRQGYSVECSWIVCTGELEETPENRRLGLESDCEQVRRSDLMVLCGPRISSGTLVEAEHAKAIVDMTHLRLELPLQIKLSAGHDIDYAEACRRAGFAPNMEGGALMVKEPP